MKDTLATYRGKPIEDLTRIELITALNEMARLYQGAISQHSARPRGLRSRKGPRP